MRCLPYQHATTLGGHLCKNDIVGEALLHWAYQIHQAPWLQLDCHLSHQDCCHIFGRRRGWNNQMSDRLQALRPAQPI